MKRLLAATCLLVLACVPPSHAEDDDDSALAWARQVVKDNLADANPAPDFPDGRDWLNVSRPLSLQRELKGKVVILDFWCYCCINCIHVLPDLEYLEHKYKDKAVAFVGVHSAKFTYERDLENIREAVRRYEIKHPVINDGDHAVWRSFGASSWPTFAVIAPDGRILGQLRGEGRRDELDGLIQALLEHFADKKILNTDPLPIRLEQAARPTGQLAYPGKVLGDGEGKRLFIADSNHNRIVEVGLDGTFRRAWGDGARGLVDGPQDKARFFRPQGMDLRDNALWVADTENHAIRKIDLTTGVVSTVSGTGKQGRLRDGVHPAKEALLSSPWDVLWIEDRLYIAMAGTHQLWSYSPKSDEVERFAGDGSEQRLDHYTLTRAAFAQPSGLAWDGKWIYVADSESSSIVRVGLGGPVDTLAGAIPENPRNLFYFGDEDGVGPGRRFEHALGVALHGSTLYVADSYNHKIKSVDTKTRQVTSLWGVDAPGFDDEKGTFSEPGGLDILGNTIYVADTNNHAIRTIDLKTKKVKTLKLAGIPIPQDMVRSGGVGEWPDLAETEVALPRTITVATDTKTSLIVKLTLPDGWKLTPDAPSALRIEGWGETRDVKIESASTTVELPAPAGDVSAATLRLLYYVCEDEGSCRIRSVQFPLVVSTGVKGKATHEVTDAFTP